MEQSKRCLLLSLAAMCLFSLSLRGVEPDAEWERDFDFLVRLGQERFDFYADMQRQEMGRRYSSRPDELKIANAVYFFSIRKIREAEQELSFFKPGHAQYTRVLYIRGTKYAELGQYAQSDKAFKEYLSLLPECPKGKRAKQEYVMALQYYNTVLKELGRGDEAAALIDRMPPDDNMGERELTYLKQLSRIDAEEGKLADGKGIDESILADATRTLKGLFFVRDGISALAAIQVGRIQTILGNSRLNALKGKSAEIAKIPHFMNAIKAIKQFQDFVAEMEDGNSKSTSPMPELLYYRGIAIRGQAEVTAAKGDLKLAGKQLSKGAVDCFRKIQSEYKKSPFVKKLPRQYMLCEDVNARWKLDVKLNLPKIDKSDLNSVFEPGDIILRDKKDYSAAAMRYKEAIDKSIENPEVVSHIGGYMQCLAMLDRYDEGQKFLEGLAQSFPAERSALAKGALMLGAFADKRMKTWPKDKPNPYKAKQEQVYFWARNLFVDNDPGHPQAPAVAYDLAVTKYNEAVAALNMAKSVTGAGQEAAMSQAHAKLKAAIPFYKRVADVFPMHQKGKTALMKIGQLYNVLDQRDGAIEHFRRFLEVSGDGSQSMDDILEAQYLIAELNFRMGRTQEALEGYEKVKELTAPGASCSQLKKSSLFREVAIAYIPDMVNRESHLLTNELGMLEERKNKLNGAIYDLDMEIREMEKGLKALPLQLSAVQERCEETVQILSSYDFDYKGKADVQAKAEAAKPNAPKTYQEYYDIFVKGVEEAARANATAEGEALSVLSKALEEEETQLVARSGGYARTLSELQKSSEKLRGEIGALQTKITGIEESFGRIGQELDDALEARAKMQETLKTSTDDAEIKRTREALKAQEALVSKLENDKLDIVSNAAKNTIIACRREIQAKEGAIADNAWQQQLQQAEQAMLELRLSSVRAQLPVVEARKAYLAKVQALLVQDEGVRLKSNADMKAEGAALAGRVRADMQGVESSLERLQGLMNAGIKRCVEQKEAFQKELSELSGRVKPLEDSWRKQKNAAVSGYREYLRVYPQGRYFAVCTTDLAGALVDLEQYSEAVGQLKNLVGGRVPECSDAVGNAKCDPQKALNALYNLAKAQTKARNYAEASGTYMRLMGSKNPAVKSAALGMPLGNLFYIADQGLEVNAPEAALIACDAILERVSSSKQAASQLRPAQIEKCMLIAAKAALLAKDFGRCRGYIERLMAMNPKTALLYDAKFLEAEAYVQQGQAVEGIGMLNQMLRKVRDTAVSNRIRCQVSRLYLMSAKPEYRDNAVNVYKSIIDFAKENIELNASWTETAEAKANQAWVDEAFVELAKLYKALGKAGELSELKGLYRKLYPDGAKISALSAIN